MALFDNFSNPTNPTIEVRNMGEISLSVGVVAILGAMTIG